jgi:hypothetical protein
MLAKYLLSEFWLEFSLKMPYSWSLVMIYLTRDNLVRQSCQHRDTKNPGNKKRCGSKQEQREEIERGDRERR